MMDRFVTLRFVTWLTMAFLLLTGPVQAQSTKQRITLLEQQLTRMEQALETNQEIQTDMLRRIQELQSENQELRNQVETLQFQSDRSADQQRALYIDLDGRLQGLEASGVAAKPIDADATGSGVPALSDREAYQLAFEHLKEGNYARAGTGFKSFIAAYPDSDLSDNAEYWLAETYYVTKEFALALDGFQRVIRDYPASRKIPDAWLKIGYCNFELENWTDAREALNTVSLQFPESTAARLAKERLGMMDANGV
jgi:tol-pal system protein YbgF